MRGDPCTSATGETKRRWPNELSAWYVCEIDDRRGHLHYAYWCRACRGWHTATARTAKQRRAAEQGITWVRLEMGLRPPTSS